MNTVEINDTEWFIDERLEEIRDRNNPNNVIKFDALDSCQAVKVFDAIVGDYNANGIENTLEPAVSR
jgi:hypothetical protein